MKKVIRLVPLFMFIALVLGACQMEPQETSGEEGNNEGADTAQVIDPEVSLSQEDQNIKSSVFNECWTTNNCSKQTFKQNVSHLNLQEVTKEAPTTTVNNHVPIQVKVQGKAPSKMSYMIQETNNDTVRSSSQVIEGNEFTVRGKGTKSVLFIAMWENKHGEFIGSLSKTMRLEVE